MLLKVPPVVAEYLSAERAKDDLMSWTYLY
jgi:hypothetical protein